MTRMHFSFSGKLTFQVFSCHSIPTLQKVFVCQKCITPKEKSARQQKLFPKLSYIMWHYSAIKKIVFQKKMVHCPIITLCKKAAHPTLKCPAPATHFWQLSSHHHSYQKYVASRVTLRVFIRTFLLKKKIITSQEIHQLFYQLCV